MAVIGRVPLALAFSLALSACGESDPSPADGGPADAGPDAGEDAAAPFEPLAPAPPALPTLAPCPEGWRAVADDATAPGLVLCDPWPAAGRQECADDEAHFPGTTGCTVVGTPCSPDDDFATDLPGEAEVVYAQAGRVGGNGLRGNPYGDLQLAIDVAAGRGAIVALSKGTFDGHFVMVEPVTLWGACTAETILTNSDVSVGGHIVEVGLTDGVVIRNLRIRGENLGIDAYELEGPLVLDAVVVSGGVASIWVDEGADLEATDLVLRDTAPAEDGQNGYGLAVSSGGRATVTRGWFSNNRNAAVSVVSPESLVTLRDVALVDTLPELASGFGGSGAAATDGGHLVLERTVVSGGQSGGVVGIAPDTIVEATDLVVTDVLPTGGLGGHGIIVVEGARFTGHRIRIDGCSQVGVVVDLGDSALEIEDLVVTDTRAAGIPAEYFDGVGIGVGIETTATLRRALVARATETALLSSDTGASLVGEDVTLLDTSPGEATHGLGLVVMPGASMALTRLHASGHAGATAQTQGELHLVDAVLEATTSLGRIAFDGWALAVAFDGRAELERVVLREAFGAGMIAGFGGTIVGRDVVVDRIAESDGAATGAFSGGEGSSIELTSFRIAGAQVCGLQIGPGATIDLHDGEVRGNPIGANVQDPDFDLTRIQEGVRYLGNGVNLDTSTLPLPAVGIEP